MIAFRRLAPLPLLLIGLAVLSAALEFTPWSVQAKSRDSGADFTLDAANGHPTDMWVADFEGHKLYAYRMPDRRRDAGNEKSLTSVATDAVAAKLVPLTATPQCCPRSGGPPRNHLRSFSPTPARAYQPTVTKSPAGMNPVPTGDEPRTDSSRNRSAFTFDLAFSENVKAGFRPVGNPDAKSHKSK